MKINKFEAYFVDLDGTVRDLGHNDSKSWYGLSEKNKQAIIKQNAITPVIISTGRDPHYTKKMLPELKLPYAICQNGAVIINAKGETVREIPMTQESAKEVIKFAHEKKLSVRMNEDDYFMAGNLTSKLVVKTLMRNTFKLIKFQNTKRDKYFKISMFGTFNRRRICKTIKELELRNLPISVVTSLQGFVMEITHKEATKGKAALWVCKEMNLDPTKCVHIGDTMNDVPAFKELGTGIAMDNATREVKNHAHFIAPHYKRGELDKIFSGKIKTNKKHKYK